MRRRGSALAWLALLLSACPPAPLPPEGPFTEARYVDDVGGDDTRDGRTPQTAWQTLERVNAFIPKVSTRIHFRRGGAWRGRLALHGGTPAMGWVAYGAYGDAGAPKPLLLGSEDVSAGWTASSRSGVWVRDWQEDPGLPAGDVAQGPGNLWFLDASGGVARWGFRKQTRDGLQAPGDFHYAPAERRIELLAGAAPSGRIEAGRNATQVDFSGQSLLVVEDLALRFGGGYAFRGHEAKHLRLRRLDVAWAGGGTKVGAYVRLGNGVEFEGSVEDAVVEDSRFFELYDTGVDCQATGNAVFTQRDVVFRHNVISRMGLACFEFWARGGAGSRLEAVRFEHNTCLFSGGGWGFVQHDHAGQAQLGADVFVSQNSALTRGCVIRDNIFFGSNVGFFAGYQPEQPATRALVDDTVVDWNLYARQKRFIAVLYAGDDPLTLPTSEKFTSIAVWRAAHGKEAHGVEADPAFVSLDAGDPFVDDLRLRAGSAARTASSDGGFSGALGPAD